MPGKPRKQAQLPAKPSAKALPTPSSSPAAKLADAAARARTVYTLVIPGAVYAETVTPMFGKKHQETASTYATNVIGRMQPRDPAEEMLITQLLLAHARVMHLSQLATKQTSLESIRVVHEYADRASNTYRRLMLTLAEYRRPPRSGDTFAVVKQANIAHQQVIQNHEKSQTNTTNEQGCTRGAGNAPPCPPALSADAGGVGRSPVIGSTGEAVGEVYRAEDRRG